jgi:hypothetical protein
MTGIHFITGRVFGGYKRKINSYAYWAYQADKDNGEKRLFCQDRILTAFTGVFRDGG